MFRSMFRTFKSLVLCTLLLLALGDARGGGEPQVKSVSVKTLLRKMSRAEIVKTFGEASFVDSLPLPPGKLGRKGTMRFTPVRFEGVSAIAEVETLNDSAVTLKLYLPYKVHSKTKVGSAFAEHSFVRATIEDFTSIEKSIENAIGVPAVFSETYFDYIVGGYQSVFGVFKDKEITITIIPTSGS